MAAFFHFPLAFRCWDAFARTALFVYGCLEFGTAAPEYLVPDAVQEEYEVIPWNQAKADQALWRALADGWPKVFLFDYDGTLAPFVPDPSKAVPYPGVAEAVERIIVAGGRVFFVTGRRCEEVPGLLGLHRPVEVFGSHGGERLHPDGTKRGLTLKPDQETGFEQAAAWATGAGFAAVLERKPGCMSFHLRSMPEEQRAEARDAAVAAWGPLSRASGLSLRDFDGGVELRVAGIHKGRAVHTVLREAGAGATVFYLGDDYTDEDAFEALGARGVSVLVRSQARPSSAKWWLRPPQELLEFLGLAASLCERDI